MIETTAPLPVAGASPWPGKGPFFGYHLPNLTFPGVETPGLFEHLVGLAAAAEGAGFDLLTVMDHFYQIGGVGPETNAMLESGSILAALAARTSRIHLGSLVSGVTYRNPAFFAKSVTTLDVISGGRAVLGLGAAWNESEHQGYGYEFPPIGERMDRLDEALTIIHAMFTEDQPSFTGRHYTIDKALNVPRPIQPGGPRVMVGGGGEQRTLKIAAKHADMTHWFPLGFEMLQHKNEVLEGYCAEIGRDPSTIERTMAAPVIVARDAAAKEAILSALPPERRPYIQGGTPQEAAEGLKRWIDAGFTGFTFNNTFYKTTEQIALVGEVLQLVGGAMG